MTQIFLPWRGEFGQMLMTHVRWVHGQGAQHRIVCCRRGDEPLFPSAQEYFYAWQSVPDECRNTKFLMSPENQEYLKALGELLQQRYPGAVLRFPLDGKKPQRFPWCPEFNFVPVPRSKAPKKFPDVLVAPRHRSHGAHRNYGHWHDVIDSLEIAGFSVGLLGTRETSVDRPGLPVGARAWDHEDNLGVTLHWMRKAKMVLCTDSGIAHLAVLAGAPLQVIYGKEGVEAGKEEWRWAYGHMRGHSTAHCEAIIGGWDDPQRVVMAVLSQVSPSVSGSCRSGTSRYPAQHTPNAAP